MSRSRASVLCLFLSLPVSDVSPSHLSCSFTSIYNSLLKKNIERPTLVVGDQLITPVPAHTLLGVILDQELRWKQQCNKALARGMSWATQLSRLAKTAYGAPAKVARRLYLSIAVPRFTYAVDVWYSPVVLSSTKGTNSSGSAGFAKRLARIQNTAARAILGGLRSTPLDSLDAHASLLPMHLLLNEGCQRSAIRLASAPSDHPLHKAIAKCSRGRKAHITLLQAILHFTGCRPADVIAWSLNRQPTDYFEQYSKFPTKTAATLNVRTDQSHIQVYSDGALSADGAGAAAVLFENRTIKNTTGLRLGNRGSRFILDMEILSVILATYLILKTPLVDDAVIFTDSQKAIHSLEGKSLGVCQALVKIAVKLLRQTRKKAGGTEVLLQWCPGHSGIKGNVLADKEAKGAASGKAFQAALVPPWLRNFEAPVDPKALKKACKDANVELAHQHWKGSVQGLKLSNRYPSARPSAFLDLIEGLERSRAVLLFRLISGHVPLQSHLARIQAAASSVCEFCGTGPETVAHFLLRCPHFSGERYIYLGSLGREFLSLSSLFSSRLCLPPLFDFVKATGRFADTFR